MARTGAGSRCRIETIATPGRGDRTYLAHDGEVGLVVDPQRDIDRVLARASAAGVRVTHVFETHVHNDYVSGGLALCRRTGATLHGAVADELSFDHVGLVEGDTVEVGALRVTAVATPGHTPTHLAYVLHEGERPAAVFTGGSMLYGAVGRTDLVGAEATDELTRHQWHGVRRLAEELPNDLCVLPTHGFGSFCTSRQGGGRDRGTVGDERRENLALLVDDVDEFVAELLSGLTEHPAYYAHMALLNRAGAFEPDLSPPEPVDPDELGTRLRAGDVPIHELLDHLHHVPGGSLWVHCASGAHASIAAGLLARAAHPVVLIDDDDPPVDASGVALTRDP